MIQEKIIFGIDRKEISHFTSIELHQTINHHHRFKIAVPHSVVESPRAFTMQNAQNWLGKVVHIQLEKHNDFLGIITNIQYTQELGHVGNQIVLTGYSKTILLESGQKLHSWEDTTLQDMIREVIKQGADEQLQNDIQPEFTHKIDYQTQYAETDFQYIQRLAKTYNEWLFYDGEKLFFGKPKKEGKRVKLTYNKDLYNLNISVQATASQFSGFTYNETYNKLYKAQTQDKVEGLPMLGNQAFDASERLYSTPSFEYGRIPTGDEAFLETLLKKRQEAAMADANYITATSSNNHLRIGTIVEIESTQALSPAEALAKGLNQNQVHYKTEGIGTYIITEITHKATDIGEYENSFKALPAFIKKLPEPQIAFPKAETQQAKVIDNADPKNQGRIRVKMLWQQTKNLRTPWLRVMTPDAGTSGEVSKNRGMVFIPEVGDHVMLGFRYNDPNRPFVMGSLFNGTTGAGGQSQNHLKSIFTRGGSTITFNELDNSILVKDPSGNTWFMDGKGNISVTAPNDITITAGANISITAGQNINTSAGINISESAGVNKTESVGVLKTLTVGTII
ncbi:phage baseplate assembly protein V [Flavobacterium branchiophilum]|uniref:type VI secretion system Vgr family protein n=1 Tax=Flavobacterium branchiophilum TaxID=55197 RepID=UPI0002DF2CA2|nr:phage baseplate assembly protein V [Flavobacterium branchiophilum]